MPTAEPVLKKLRRERGTLREVAAKVGATKSAIVHWDAMRAEPQPRYRAAYAAFLGLTVAELGALIYEESIKPRARRAKRA